MTTLCHNPTDIRLDAATRSTLMALRSTLAVYRKGLVVVTNPELSRIIRKAIAVTQFDIRAIQISGKKRR